MTSSLLALSLELKAKILEHCSFESLDVLSRVCTQLKAEVQSIRELSTIMNRDIDKREKLAQLRSKLLSNELAILVFFKQSDWVYFLTNFSPLQITPIIKQWAFFSEKTAMCFLAQNVLTDIVCRSGSGPKDLYTIARKSPVTALKLTTNSELRGDILSHPEGSKWIQELEVLATQNSDHKAFKAR